MLDEFCRLGGLCERRRLPGRQSCPFAVSRVTEPRSEALLCRDRERLQSERHKIVNQLVANIPTRPPTDHVGDDSTGIVRLGEGSAMRVTHVGFWLE